MKTFLKIAWRNIWRNSRRTFLTATAIAFSFFIVVNVVALGDGGHWAMIRNSLELFSGYLQVQRPGYQKDPRVEQCFPYSEKLQSTLRKITYIKAFTPRLEAGCLVASEGNSLGAMVVGIDPETEARVSVISQKVVTGTFIGELDSKSCVIGLRMAEYLSISPCSKIVVVTQGIDGSTGAMKLKVKGLVDTGLPELDRNLVFIHIRDAGYLLRADGMAHRVVCSVGHPSMTRTAVRELGSLLKEEDCRLTVLGYDQLVPEIIQLVELDDAFGYLFLAIVLLVVVFGLLSAVFTSVLERTREFGLMLALGTRPYQLIGMILAESLLVVVTGLTGGLSTGLATAYYLVDNPIPLPSASAEVMAGYGMQNMLYFEVHPVKIAVISCTVILLSLLLALYPAWMAARLEPDKALRAVDN